MHALSRLAGHRAAKLVARIAYRPRPQEDTISRMSYELFLTVDLEDFRRIRCNELGLRPRSGSYYVEKGVDRILTAAERAQKGTHLTFFTTAQIARDQGDLVRRIVKAGHEIACHSFDHECVSSVVPERFRLLLRRATRILEDLSGHRVIGYRAPSFRLPADPQWFYEILADEGYVYSSSACLSARRLSEAPYNSVLVSGGRILEFPTYTAYQWSPWPVRTIGGTFFRLLPLTMIEALLVRAMQAGYAPMVWLHPSDVVSDFRPVSWDEARRSDLRQVVQWPVDQFIFERGTRGAADKLGSLLSRWKLRGSLAAIALTALSESPGLARRLRQNERV